MGSGHTRPSPDPESLVAPESVIELELLPDPELVLLDPEPLLDPELPELPLDPELLPDPDAEVPLAPDPLPPDEVSVPGSVGVEEPPLDDAPHATSVATTAARVRFDRADIATLSRPCDMGSRGHELPKKEQERGTSSRPRKSSTPATGRGPGLHSPLGTRALPAMCVAVVCGARGP